MRAAVFVAGTDQLSVEDVTPVAPRDGDVVVRITATAPCATDLAVARDEKDYGSPLLTGHEACGVVDWVGPAVGGLRVGDRVVASSAPRCGRCWNCVHGHPNICERSSSVRTTPRATRADGATVPAIFGLGTFAESMTVDQSSLVAVATDLDDALLCLVGCGVTTGLGAALVRADLSPGSTVAIVGCGTVGLSAVQGARLAGASTIIAIDPAATRRELAGQLGATLVLDPGTEDVVARAQQATGGRGVDTAIDAVGHLATFRQAFDLTRRAGSVLLVGLPPPGSLPVDAWDFFLSEKRISSSLFGSVDIQRDLPRFVALAESGQLDLASLVTSSGRLDDVNGALHLLAAGSGLRTVLAP